MGSDPVLNGLAEWLPILIPAVIAFVVIGAVISAVLPFLLVLAVAAAMRKFNSAVNTVAQQAPSPGQLPSPEWVAQVAQLPNLWSQMNAVQQARSENKKAEMMGLAAQAGISLPPF